MRRITFDFMARQWRQRALNSILQLTAEEKRNARSRRKKGRLRPRVQTRLGPGYQPPLTGTTVSRQVRRRAARMRAFQDITKRFHGEPRRIRRNIAFDLVRNQERARRIA